MHGILGYRSKLPWLREQFLYGDLPEYLQQAVADALVRHISAEELHMMLTTTPRGISRDMKVQLQQRRSQLVEALARTDHSALVPDLLTFLNSRALVEDVHVRIAEAIGILGYKKSTVEQLLDRWRPLRLRDPRCTSLLADTLYRALWTVCRKARVTIVPTGPGKNEYVIGFLDNFGVRS